MYSNLIVCNVIEENIGAIISYAQVRELKLKLVMENRLAERFAVAE